MKRNLLLLFMLLGLGLSACKQEESTNPQTEEETFVLNNEKFNVNDTKIKFSMLLGIPFEDLTFVKDSIAFHRKGYNDLYKLEPFMSNIKLMKLK